MKKHLFLTGASGVGKTTLIRNALGTALPYAGGFITERHFSDDGFVLGYDLYPAAAAADFSVYDGKRFLDYSGEKPAKDNEVFRTDAVRLLREAEYYPYAMIDEFGGFEVIIPQFRDALAEFLNLEIPIIGVIKEANGVEKIKERFGLGSRFTDMAELIKAVIANDSDCEIIEMTQRGEERVKKLVDEWVKEYIRA